MTKAEMKKRILTVFKIFNGREETILDECWKEVDKLQEENKVLKEQIKKMKCCENCKYSSYWGNEVHCNYGLKEAVQQDKLVECHDMDKWELKEQ